MLTLGQKEFMEGVHKFIEKDYPRKEYLSLQGSAGCGKTYVVTSIKEEFPELNIIYVAFTGKAVDNLMAKGVPSDTIYSAFYNVDSTSEKLRFKLKKPYELPDYDVVIIDEFSQLSQQMVDDLFSFGIKLIFVGDYEQLGNVVGTPTDYLKHADYVLDEVVRQAKDSTILKLLNEYRLTGVLPPYGKYSEDVYLMPKDRVTENIIVHADQCICGTNATKDVWNKRVREAYHRKDYLPEIGERVISVKNMKQVICDGRMIINGTTGYVNKIKVQGNGTFMMEFRPTWTDESCYLRVDSNYFYGKKPKDVQGLAEFEWGYVITVNKAQGSEYNNVLFIVDNAIPPQARRANIITGITRAKKKLVIAYDR